MPRLRRISTLEPTDLLLSVGIDGGRPPAWPDLSGQDAIDNHTKDVLGGVELPVGVTTDTLGSRIYPSRVKCVGSEISRSSRHPDPAAACSVQGASCPPCAPRRASA